MIQQTIAKKMLLAIMPVIVVFVLGIILLSGSYHKEINQANKNKITTILDLISPLVELQLSLGNLDEIQKIIRTPSQLDGIISITVSDVDNQFITSINTKAAEKKNQNIKEHRRDIVQLFGANESGRLKIGEIVILEDTTWGTRKLTQIQEIAIPSFDEAWRAARSRGAGDRRDAVKSFVDEGRRTVAAQAQAESMLSREARDDCKDVPTAPQHGEDKDDRFSRSLAFDPGFQQGNHPTSQAH